MGWLATNHPTHLTEGQPPWIAKREATCINVAAASRDAQNRDFFNLLTSEALLPERRKRLYPPTVALSLFMCQTLEVDGSCQKAVRR